MSESILYVETCEAVERCRTGKDNPAQLQRWLLGHFEEAQSDKKTKELQSVLLLVLAVYLAADLPREELSESLKMIAETDHPALGSLHSPLMRNPKFREVAFSGNPPWPIKPFKKSQESQG